MTKHDNPTTAGSAPFERPVVPLVERLRACQPLAEFHPSLAATYTDIFAAADEIERLSSAPFWWRCDTHGMALPHNAWGCPECVRELRDEVRLLRAERAQALEMLAEQRRTIFALMVGMPDDGTTPVIRRIAALDEEREQLRGLLRRYRDETPLGHQPHMIAHLVDEALRHNDADERKPPGAQR